MELDQTLNKSLDVSNASSVQDDDTLPHIEPLGKEATKAISEHVKPRYSFMMIMAIAQGVETLILLALGLGIYFAYLGVSGGQLSFYFYSILLVSLMHLVLSNAMHSHSIVAYRTMGYQTARIVGSWIGVMLLASFIALFAKMTEEYSRVWFALWFVSGFVSLITFRLLLRSLIWRWTKAGLLVHRAVIIGGGDLAEDLIQAIEKSKNLDVEILGFFDDRSDDRSPLEIAGKKKLGKVQQLVEFARRTPVDIAIVSLPLSAEKRVISMLKKIWVLPVDIRLSAHSSELKLRPRTYSYVGEVPLLDIIDKPMGDWDLMLKWCLDKTAALMAVLLLSPVFLVTAILVKLTSRGPIFFKQKRYGFNNELVEVYKFRSMYTDMSDEKASKLVTKDDPRVTRIGRILRKTSIDELPQLFNVLKGEISLVGPRPHAESAKVEDKLYYDAVDGYFARHKVKPGITGWAQINGWRGETDTYEKIFKRIECDLYYIENYSIFLDIYILAITPFSILTQTENAY